MIFIIKGYKMKGLIVLTVLLVQEITPALMSPLDTSSEDIFEDQRMIQSLIGEENEIKTEDDHQQKIKSRPLQYPMEILKQFETNPKFTSDARSSVTLKINNETFSKPRDRLFQIWLPVEIVGDMDANRTLVAFQQTVPRKHFGNFTSSQITLTLLDVQLSPTTYLKMFMKLENDEIQHESIKKIHIEPGRKFYSFDITEFISLCLKTNLTKPNLIKIGFQAYEIHGKNMTNLDFSRIFDVQVDMPLIMYFYGGFVPSETSVESSIKKRRSRSIENRETKTKRGIRGRPYTQCQRRSFTVKPADVDWNDLDQPQELNLSYCSGTCPFPLEDSYYNYTFHSFLLSRYRLHHVMNLPNDFPQSTCIPVTYKKLSVIVRLGPDRQEAGVVHDLLVDSCGCRMNSCTLNSNLHQTDIHIWVN